MKKSLLIVFTFFFCSLIYAQDVIIKKDKKEIKTKIVEITDTVIKYKFWERLDGPLYNIYKKDVFMIIYSSGEREFFEEKTTPINQITTSTVNTVNSTNKIGVAHQEYKVSGNSNSNDYNYGTPTKLNFGTGRVSEVDAFGMQLSFVFGFTKDKQGSLEMELTPFFLLSSFDTSLVSSSTTLYGGALSFGYGFMATPNFKLSGGVGYYYGAGSTEIDVRGEPSVTSEFTINDVYYYGMAEYLIFDAITLNARYDEILGFGLGFGASF